MPVCPPQIPHGLAQDQTSVSAVRGEIQLHPFLTLTLELLASRSGRSVSAETDSGTHCPHSLSERSGEDSKLVVAGNRNAISFLSRPARSLDTIRTNLSRF